MHNLSLETHQINAKCPKCARIITETIGKLRNSLTVSCATCNHDFDINENEFQQKVEKIEANIKYLKESLKKAL